MLPARGRTGVEDVLFGREQRQAVGIKVDRSLAHCGKKFPDHSRSFSVHGSRCVSGWGLEYFLENSRSRKLGFSREKTAANVSTFIQCGPFRSKRSDPCSRCVLTAWRRLGLHTVFVQLVKNTFLWGAPHLLLREWKA